MINKPMIVVAAVVVLAGAGIAYYFHTHNAQPARLPAGGPPAPAEPSIEHPVPNAQSTASAPLPALNDSDPAIRDALTTALGKGAMQYLVPESLVRHIVVTIDNLPRQKVAVEKRRCLSRAPLFANRSAAASVPSTECLPAAAGSAWESLAAAALAKARSSA